MFSRENDQAVHKGLASIEEEFDEGISQALASLTEIGKGYLSERKDLEAERTVSSIKEIGRVAALRTCHKINHLILQTPCFKCVVPFSMKLLLLNV